MKQFSLLLFSFVLFFIIYNFDRTHGKPNMSKSKIKESILMNGPKRLQRKHRVPVANIYNGVHSGSTNRLRRQIHIGIPTPPPVPRIPVPYPYKSKSENVNESGNLSIGNRKQRQIHIGIPTPPPVPSIPSGKRKRRSLTPSDLSTTGC
ncbi:hypothetical protein Mgra_00006339 [Meloidogyne graminicola]|uniref:Uncharacterized protein n=1 Tax=Meloidogyne graminicola TaxID=189291 RepID=A0A8S9ZLZ7_9BILA|nr:hypothetical protein Mgra_00006339 [Meloidogyne graminicola]